MTEENKQPLEEETAEKVPESQTEGPAGKAPKGKKKKKKDSYARDTYMGEGGADMFDLI